MIEPSQHRPYAVMTFGEEAEPVVMIDDFSAEPERLKAHARTLQFTPGGNHYPGHRAPAPADYLGERMDVLQQALSDVFGVSKGADLAACSYSLVTTPPDRLTPIQRLPHFDGTDRGILAVLHYLCGPGDGGTSFYRHRATGYETIGPERLAAYDAALQGEVKEDGLPPAQYFSGSNNRFEKTGSVDAAWNRLVIYRGWRLHSGDIPKASRIGQPGEEPRLTINTFLRAR